MSSYLNSTQFTRALILLSGLHIFIIAISNYLVQLPLNIFGITTTWGTLSFPFIFLITDLSVRIFGKQQARKIIFYAMFPALLVSYYFSVAFFKGEFVGHAGLLEFNLFVFRIVLASFVAYCVGQLMDIHVFDRLRQQKKWWIAPAASTFIGNLVDTLCFFSIAFYKSGDEFMANHWVEIGTVDYLFKLFMGFVIFLPAYGILLNYLQRKILSQENQKRAYSA